MFHNTILATSESTEGFYLVIASQNILNLKIYWNDIFYFLKFILILTCQNNLKSQKN
jgi:hypothetical protein